MGTGDIQIQQDEQGWSFTDDYICSSCINEPAIQAAVAGASAASEECSFCDNTPAASLDVVMKLFVEGLRRLYEPTLDVLYFDDDVTTRQDGSDLVYEHEHLFVGEGVIDAVLASINHEEWVARDFAVPHHGDAMVVAWDDFCRQVKFGTRYMIWLRPLAPWEGVGGEVPVAEVLDRVSEIVEKFGLIKMQPALTTWWRAQPHGPDPIEHTAARLGTVPAELAFQPNRMSPAGIPMFYGAADAGTAKAEVATPPGTTGPEAAAAHAHVTWGAFATSRETRVVDLSTLPPIPSIFDPQHGDDHDEVQFLHSFVRQLSSKSTPAWEAVDYVPTQVLTEYFLRVHGVPDHAVDGLVYTSAITGTAAVVLDVPNDRCVIAAPGWQDTPDGELQLGLDLKTIATTP